MYRSFKPVGVAMPIVLAAMSTLALFSTTAQAQTPADNAAQTSTISELFGTQTDVSIGVGAGVDQRYMGAKDFRFDALPTFNISRGIFFADFIRGAGVQYQTASGFYISQTFNYDYGRADENDFFRPGSDYLKGMGDVKGTVTSTVTLSQRITPWLSVNAQAEFGLDGHVRGNQYQFGLESTALQTAADTIVFDLDAKLGDGQYNQTYFGVTPSQSINSGLRPYSPGAGLYAISLAATWTHKFDKRWSADLMLDATRYTNTVADSPVVQRRTGLTVFTSVGYTF
ncbi:MAG: MipA/OmpV family protein [Paraburkholderia sp.]|jgi:outer membrane protein|uniref:MipA/OmpV family protein n=1 Tax=Burkholderiaceae TaxID=119060 RepID=UPI0010F89CAF|nr:MipA/OmpV family protein [Burkholderia sp. 4M9327F10]